MPRLITIPFSHYCEKARWALDRAGIPFEEDGHLPIFHYLPTWRAGATRTVPIVIDGATRLTDSTDIIAWADARTPGSLLPRDPTTRAAALVLEDDFDRQLGPATRRWGYSQLMPRRDLDATVLTRGVPRWEAALLRLTRPVAVALLRRGLNITREGVARSLLKIDETFAQIDQLLGDGRRYLMGDQFTVADLTFAALSAPILLPDHHPYPMPPLAEYASEGRAKIEVWRTTAAGRHCQRMYATERSRGLEIVSDTQSTR